MNLNSRLIPFKDFYDRVFSTQFPYVWQFFSDENGFIIRRLERKDSNKGVFYGAVLRHDAPVFLIDSRIYHFVNEILVKKDAKLSEIFQTIYASTNRSKTFCEALAAIIERGNSIGLGWYHHDSITGHLYYRTVKGEIQAVNHTPDNEKPSRIVIHAAPYPQMQELFREFGFDVMFTLAQQRL
jgi:hypothetical protein